MSYTLQRNLTLNVTFLDADYSIWQPYIQYFRYFVTWFVPVLIVFGVVGTSLSLVVLLRRKASSQSDIRIWFVSLSLADMFSLTFGLSMFYLSRIHYAFNDDNNFQRNWDFRHYNALNCYLLNILLYFGLLLSTWLQASISLLRALSIHSPLLMRTRLTKRNTLTGLTCVVLACFITSSLLVVLSMEYSARNKLYQLLGQKHCRLRPKNNLFYYGSLTLKVILPISCLSLSSLVIIRSLRVYNIALEGSVCEDPNRQGAGTLSRSRMQQRKISYLLLSMNAAFLLCTLPFEVFKTYYYYWPATLSASSRPTQMLVAQRIADKMLNVLAYTNNATNWLFYFMLGPTFRKEVCKLIRPRCKCCKNEDGFDNQNLGTTRHMVTGDARNFSRKSTKSTKRDHQTCSDKGPLLNNNKYTPVPDHAYDPIRETPV